MAGVTMKIEGMEALQRVLQTAPDLVRSKGVDAINVTSFAIAQRAKSLVRVDSGDLQRSIEAKRTVTSLSGGIGINTKSTYYWWFLEFGTVKMAARPFVRPAAEAEQDAYIQRWQAIGRNLERDLSTSRFL